MRMPSSPYQSLTCRPNFSSISYCISPSSPSMQVLSAISFTLFTLDELARGLQNMFNIASNKAAWILMVRIHHYPFIWLSRYKSIVPFIEPPPCPSPQLVLCLADAITLACLGRWRDHRIWVRKLTASLCISMHLRAYLMSSRCSPPLPPGLTAAKG